jgi:hypothetical protein
VDRLNAWARSGLEALQGLSLLQVLLISVLGLGLGYWAIGIAVRSLRSAVLAFLVLIAALALVRLCFPETFCSVHWPTPIAAVCSRRSALRRMRRTTKPRAMRCCKRPILASGWRTTRTSTIRRAEFRRACWQPADLAPQVSQLSQG